MNGEEDFHVENTNETERSQHDVCVLLLDSDDTCLMNLSEMMRECGYRVVATTRADDLPFIINNKDDKIDLVLAEFRLIEKNKYELLEKIRLICEIPVVVVGAYVKKAVILDCLCRGAKFYLKKPLQKRNLENLWQFTVSQREFVSRNDTNPLEKKYSVTCAQSRGDELNRTNKNNKVKADLDEKFESGEQKKRERICPEMQNGFRQTDELSQEGNKRKERVETDTGEHTEKDYGCGLGKQKKPKLNCEDGLQNKTFEAISNIEGNKERKEPTEIKKNGEGSEEEKRGLVCMREELEKWSTQPVIDFAAYVEYEFEEGDFQPLESVGECVAYPLSPQESSNRDVVGELQTQKKRLGEEVMQDGISLSDLEFDLQEGQGSTSDLKKKANQERLDEIFTDLANELKP